MDRIELNGVKIYPFDDADKLIDYIDERKGILVAINAQKVVDATKKTREIINNNVGYCDGAGPVMALKRRGYKNVHKIAGADLWLKIVERFYRDPEKGFYLVGAKNEVITETVEKLKKEYPGINIVGWRDGYLNEGDEERLIADIEEKKPYVVFVAMGSPKQELLMGKMEQRHKAIYQGLGGSWNVYTGKVKRAPRWMCEHNMEFIYRYVNRPKRFIPIFKFKLKDMMGKL